jgi:hypothetical protein
MLMGTRFKKIDDVVQFDGVAKPLTYFRESPLVGLSVAALDETK